MTTTTDQVMETLVAARDAWAAYRVAVDDLKRTMRERGGFELELELERVEAYDALVGRDEGAGMNVDGWLDEIEQAIDQTYADEASAEYFAAGGAA